MKRKNAQETYDVSWAVSSLAPPTFPLSFLHSSCFCGCCLCGSHRQNESENIAKKEVNNLKKWMKRKNKHTYSSFLHCPPSLPLKRVVVVGKWLHRSYNKTQESGAIVIGSLSQYLLSCNYANSPTNLWIDVGDLGCLWSREITEV